MFDWMLPEKHAIAILKKDHDTVKEPTDNAAMDLGKNRRTMSYAARAFSWLRQTVSATCDE